MPDIWGKICRQVESKKAAEQASAADLANATLSARAQLEGGQAQLINARVARAQYEHAIAMLVGKPHLSNWMLLSLHSSAGMRME